MCETLKACIQGCAKIILILINVIALLAGIAMVGVGIFTMVKGSEYIPDVGVSLTPAAVCLIILGVALLFIGSFGCFGAITGRHALLNVYLILLGIIVILEIAVLIFGFINKGAVEKNIKAAITEPFADVNEAGFDADVADLVQVASVQELATCCGIDGPSYWTNADFNGKVPASCCKDAAEDEQLCAVADAYPDGCLSSSEGLVKKGLTLVIVVIVIVILFQLICMIMAWCSRGEYQVVGDA